MNRAQLMGAAIKAAVPAGTLLMQHYNNFLEVAAKESLRDVVTQVDKLAENQIIGILNGIDDSVAIVTEEQGQVRGGKDAESYWIIDALDGTVNYVNHVPFFCVSIAFVENGSPVVGVIYNPVLNDLYYGAEGVGAFKNQTRLVIKDKPPDECLFSATFSGKSFEPGRRKDEFQLFGEINDHSRGVLRTGSAAMNLAYLAEGKLGGCWGKANKSWDIGAGLVIAGLAGAKVKFKEVDKEKRLVSYIATVPSAWDFVLGRAAGTLGF